jgi:hypothetical protein
VRPSAFSATARPPGKLCFGTVQRTFEGGWKVEVSGEIGSEH